jgi:hypothetical protein
LLGTGKIKGRNGSSTNQIPTPLDDWDGYEITATGWKDMLTLSYKHPGNDLTSDQILISSGGDKRGLLNDFLSAAGKAKVFYPKHLRSFLEPMLTLFSVRLIIAVKGDIREREEVKHKMIEEIKKSMEDDRGLKGFPEEVEAVLHNLEHFDVRNSGPLARWRETDRYIDALYKSRGWTTTRVDFRGWWEKPKNDEEKHYIQYKKKEKLPPAPAGRTGSLIDKEQEKH